MKIKLIVQNGQYEQSASIVCVTYTSNTGLLRRARQLSKKHAVYGDNWAGWINAQIAIADPGDIWTKNQIIGGRSCEPVNGWLNLN